MKNPKKVLKTIQDLIETGDSENYKIVREDKSMQALKNLTEIYGIGPKKAMDLYNKNEIFDV